MTLTLRGPVFLPPQGETIGFPSSHAYNKQGNSFDRSTSCGRWPTGPIFLRHTGCRFNVVAVHMIKVDMASSSGTFDCHEDIADNTCRICQFLNLFFIFCWPCIMYWFLVNDQRDAQFFMYLFIFLTLYMFPAHRAHQQERQIVSIQPLALVTLCLWPCRVQVGSWEDNIRIDCLVCRSICYKQYKKRYSGRNMSLRLAM